MALTLAPVCGETIWIEGENALKSDTQRNGWYDSVKMEELSGNGTLRHWGNRPGKAVYSLDVRKAGKYALWLRANPVQSSLAYRVGTKPWQVPNLRKESRESINIAADNKPDLRFVAWVRAGVVDLKEGGGTLEVRFDSKNHFHGMLDCLCLTTDLDWQPRGTVKPGEKAPFWAAPAITRRNLDEWQRFIRPSNEELGWRAVRWHRSLSEAAAEAKKLNRPILLWAMNGHPCGET